MTTPVRPADLRRERRERKVVMNWAPYRRSLYAAPPTGWFPAPPDFVGIGTQKAGTTWWYRLIEAHPRVFTRHPQKERHFFERFGARRFTDFDALRYAELFYRPPGGVSGEWTPGYINDFWIPALLARAAPRAKLLVLLRSPEARYLSGVRHNLYAEGLPLRVAQRDSFERGRYFAQLEIWLRHFPAEQILPLQYERCVADPVGEIRRTYAFLALDPVDFVPPNLEVQFNESRGPRFEAPAHVTEQLVDLYADDVAALKATWPEEIDLNAWPRFADLSWTPRPRESRSGSATAGRSRAG